MKTSHRITLLMVLLLMASTSFAHRGGHGRKSTELRTWNITDQASIKGTFFFEKKGEVYLEKENGEIVHLSIDQLSKESQQYVNERTEKIKKLNALETQHTHSATINRGTSFNMFFALLGVAVLIGGLFWFNRKSLHISLASLSVVLILYACGDDDTTDLIDDDTATTGTPNANDATTMKLAFAPYSNVSTYTDDNYFYVESNGIPDHQMMVNITAWIAQVPVPHDYTGSNAWPIPLNPEYAASPISIEGNFQRGAIAIAANGIPIFNPINASGDVSNDIGELDDFGGHSGRGDDYHYHVAPLHLESTSGTQPLAYALDGFAVYGSAEPDGSAMQGLDTYHGHEDGDGGYHYHGTDTYPYLIGAMRGEVTLEGDAPQNQVSPQARAFPPRSGDPHGINSDDLIITALTANATGNGYLLEYTKSSIQGSVEYSWDANDFFTFIFNDVDGKTTTETFQR